MNEAREIVRGKLAGYPCHGAADDAVTYQLTGAEMAIISDQLSKPDLVAAALYLLGGGVSASLGFEHNGVQMQLKVRAAHDMDALRVAVARIIDPFAWGEHDTRMMWKADWARRAEAEVGAGEADQEVFTRMRRLNQDEAARVVKLSLQKADGIIALIELGVVHD